MYMYICIIKQKFHKKCLLFHKTVYILFNTIRSQCNVCNRCASRELNLLVVKITHFNCQSSHEALLHHVARTFHPFIKFFDQTDDKHFTFFQKYLALFYPSWCKILYEKNKIVG